MITAVTVNAQTIKDTISKIYINAKGEIYDHGGT